MIRMEKFLNDKGRQIIGWDEILEGDVAPNATVMSWRGIDGGIKAAQLGHDVIMAPNTYCYFDYYQTADTKDEPLAIGGYLPIEKVYNMAPIPGQLAEEEKRHIIWVQANVWTEYIPTTQQVEYMVMPRIAALSEVQWTQPEKKSYKDFTGRLISLMKIYEREGLNHAGHIFDIKVEFVPVSSDKAVKIILSTVDDAPIYYTLNGTSPDANSARYDSPLSITKDADFRAVAIRHNEKSKEVERNISFNKATFQPIELEKQPSDKYKFNGAITLVNGLRGNDNYATGEWLGFTKCHVEAILDLGNEMEITRVFTDAIVDMGSWIMGSSEIVVSVSLDKKDFREITTKSFPLETDISAKKTEMYEVQFPSTRTRYVQIVIKPSPALPKGHAGEGYAPYLFVDEIGVE
jgi:hexosaminidase